MESVVKGKVCVTGGTGFVASWLIKRLLENGYSVTTTVRADPGLFSFLFFGLCFPFLDFHG